MSRAKRRRDEGCPYVGRGGLKLRFALDHFKLDPKGLICADLGCHIGGFTDCMLQAGATKVYAVDTAYGVIEWNLRNDARVEVLERTNALHWRPPEPVDFLAIDAGWTAQELILRAAREIVRVPGDDPNIGAILSLVKPQYELRHMVSRGVIPRSVRLYKGVVPPKHLPLVLESARATIPEDLELLGEVQSPHTGSGGNIEYWWWLRRRNA